MDFEPDAEQQELQRAIGVLVERHAGFERARALAVTGAYDSDLEERLDEAGFLDLVGAEGGGPLAATFVVEGVARALGTVAIGTRALALPAVGLDRLDGPVALCDAAVTGPVRFANAAATLVVLDGDVVRAGPAAGAVTPVVSPYGFPFGRVDTSGASPIDADAAALRNWWRVALAAEITGLLTAGLEATVRYVSGRHQFGRPLAAFQAVQHKLAECHVSIEGTRWLVRWAAFHGAGDEAAAIAAAHAVQAARTVAADLHQVSGAMGFTEEHDLSLATLRATAVAMELGGGRCHQRAVAEARWP